MLVVQVLIRNDSHTTIVDIIGDSSLYLLEPWQECELYEAPSL